MDVRPGGSWRFINIDAAGNEYGFHGVYNLIEPPKRVVQHSVFQSVEDRDGMVQSGMEKGASETMDRLAELLAELLKEKRAL
jgi:uncharacterized protein YndB with AHSA1/START domain